MRVRGPSAMRVPGAIAVVVRMVVGMSVHMIQTMGISMRMGDVSVGRQDARPSAEGAALDRVKYGGRPAPE